MEVFIRDEDKVGKYRKYSDTRVGKIARLSAVNNNYFSIKSLEQHDEELLEIFANKVKEYCLLYKTIDKKQLVNRIDYLLKERY